MHVHDYAEESRVVTTSKAVRKRVESTYPLKAEDNQPQAALPNGATTAMDFRDVRSFLKGEWNYFRGVWNYFLLGLFNNPRGLLSLFDQPLGLLFAAYLATLVGSYALYHILSALPPLCTMSVMSQTPLCTPLNYSIPPETGEKPVRWVNFNRLVEMQGKAFETLLDESFVGSSLALEIKRTEMATVDLITAVSVSDLYSRETLATTLRGFVEDAKKVGQGLHKLNAKVGGTADGILAMNEYALNAIEAINSQPPSIGESLLSLNPWAGPPPIRAGVLDTFHEAMSVCSKYMRRLIMEAERLLSELTALEATLDMLHDLVTREKLAFEKAKKNEKEKRWPWGCDEDKLEGLDRQLRLLGHVGQYRKRARAHVGGALTVMRGMSADMDELREQVATPQIVGDRVPIEVQMSAIRAGLERLWLGRLRARKSEEEAMRKVLEADDVEY